MRGAVAAGHGVVSAARLEALGIPARLLKQWVRAGVLVPVRRGVYTTSDLWESWDEYAGRPSARIRAAELTITVPHTYSHDSSAILRQMRLLRPQDSAVHITRDDLRGSRTRFGIEHHGALVDPSHVGVVDDLPALDVPRTVVDLAREHGYVAGLVAADGALRAGVPRDLLADAAAAMAGWPFSLTVRAVVQDADGGAESVGETLMRELVLGCGLGATFETQFPVLTRRGIRWCDLRVGRQLFEFDGRIKYLAVEDGGLDDRELEQILWSERRRGVELTDESFGLTRLVYADHWGAARVAAEQRIQRDYADTLARFGTELTASEIELAARSRRRGPAA